MTIRPGQALPEATLQTMTHEGVQSLSTKEIFGGKRVVLFALPGAFTPVCSDKHLPGFIMKAEQIKATGIDLIACVSVNDAYVMHAWRKSRNVGDRILMLADGNGEFTRAVGLEKDNSHKGMGFRSRRYAAVIEDGIVESLHVEPAPGLDVSSAESMLEVLSSVGEPAP